MQLFVLPSHKTCNVIVNSASQVQNDTGKYECKYLLPHLQVRGGEDTENVHHQFLGVQA